MNLKFNLCFIFIFLLVCKEDFSQISPKKIKYKGETLLIYPSRAGETPEVPPTAARLPDGKYALLTNFIFKRNPLKKKMILKDTLKVCGVFYLKNNLPEGDARFFFFNLKRNWSLKKNYSREITGTYKSGLKEGEWVTREEKKVSSRTNYTGGILNGRKTEYNKKGNLVSKEIYKDGELADTIFEFSNTGVLIKMYDLTSEKDTETVNDLNTSFYNFIFENEGVIYIDELSKTKSFYKEYDEETGRLTNNIHFKNGSVIAFDTIYDGEKKYLVNRIKSESEDSADYFCLTKIVNSPAEVSTEKKYYHNQKLFRTDFEGRHFYYFFDQPVRRRKKADPALQWVHEKYSEFYINLDKIDEESYRDTIIGWTIYPDYKISYHLIPAMGYCWREATGAYNWNFHRPSGVDTSTKRITSDYETGAFFSDNLKSRGKVILCKKKERIIEQKNNFRKLGFIFTNEIALPHNKMPVYHNETFGEPSYFKEYEGVFSERVFSDSLDKVLNGEHIIETYSLQGIPALLRKAKGNFINGKMEGTWSFTDYEGDKYLKTDFLKILHNKRIRYNHYSTAAYSNGHLNGLLENWQKDKEYDEDFTGTPSRKNPVHKLYTYKESQSFFANDTLHGVHTSFYHNGQTRFTCNFNMGKLEGTATSFSYKGVPEMTANFKNDKLDGDFIEYREGKKIKEGTFRNNNLNGSYVLYDFKEGKKIMEIIGENGILKSKKTWFNNGKLQEELLFSTNSAFELEKSFSSFYSYLEITESNRYTEDAEKMFGLVKTYYDNGQLLLEGGIEKGKPAGIWKFYNINGALTSEVLFKDTSWIFPGDPDKTFFKGLITAFYNNGKMRCKGFLKDHSTSYDCGTRQQKTNFDIAYTDFFNYDGIQVVKNGEGTADFYDENGLKISGGAFVKYKQEGIWKYFDPNQKLNKTGKYIRGEEDGLWYSGDLEGLNFEDAACFDPEDKNAQKEFEYSKKNLQYEVTLYRLGEEMSSENFTSNVNTEIEYRTRPYKPFLSWKWFKKRSRHYEIF